MPRAVAATGASIGLVDTHKATSAPLQDRVLANRSIRARPSLGPSLTSVRAMTDAGAPVYAARR